MHRRVLWCRVPSCVVLLCSVLLWFTHYIGLQICVVLALWLHIRHLCLFFMCTPHGISDLTHVHAKQTSDSLGSALPTPLLLP